MEDKSNKKKEDEIFLSLIMLISDSSSIFNKRKIIDKTRYIFKEDDIYLILKSNHESFAIANSQKLIEEKEILIFKKDKTKYQIKLVNLIDRLYNCSRMEKLYEINNKLNFYLYKSIPKLENYDLIDEKNVNFYTYHLKEDDIIRLGTVKIIIREFHTFPNNNNNGNNNDCSKKFKRQFTFLLEPSNETMCDICDKPSNEPNDPLIKFCLCERYTHFKCMKEKLKKMTIIDNDNNGCTRFFIKTNCIYCKKFIPWSFVCKENNDYKLYELIDIPRNNSEEYLILEVFDFFDHQHDYIKYIFYIKFRKQAKDKNVETIMIGGDRRKSDKYKFDKLVKIGNINSISSQHAFIDYDIESKTLVLTNISETHNTLVLQDEYIMEPKGENKLLLELGNIKFEAQLKSSKEFDNIEKSLAYNPDKIEIRRLE